MYEDTSNKETKLNTDHENNFATIQDFVSRNKPVTLINITDDIHYHGIIGVSLSSKFGEGDCACYCFLNNKYIITDSLDIDGLGGVWMKDKDLHFSVECDEYKLVATDTKAAAKMDFTLTNTLEGSCDAIKKYGDKAFKHYKKYEKNPTHSRKALMKSIENGIHEANLLAQTIRDFDSVKWDREYLSNVFRNVVSHMSLLTSAEFTAVFKLAKEDRDAYYPTMQVITEVGLHSPIGDHISDLLKHYPNAWIEMFIVYIGQYELDCDYEYANEDNN